jgi:hypothetical protein
MEVWYEAQFRAARGNPIKRKEFVRSTDKMLIDGYGNKHAKETTYSKAFLDWEEAKAFLINRAEDAVAYAEKKLESERKSLAEIKALAKQDAAKEGSE